MPVIDLSGTPSDEPCAQIGTRPEATDWSRQEAIAYRAALIAAFGPPPAGYQLSIKPNHHDFGTYYTIALRSPETEAMQLPLYEAMLEKGLRYWHEAVMSPPIDYSDPHRPSARHPTHSGTESIIGAILSTRPDAKGHFALPLFKTINVRLRTAYPDLGHLADARLTTQLPPTLQ